jgi:GNAT superfamily N-acetyltransferase
LTLAHSQWELPMSVSLRPASPADGSAAGRICYKAFKAIAERHGFPPDFPTPDVAIGLMDYMLAQPSIYGVIAECDGRVAGSNFLWEEGPLAGVGPITVDPGVQNGAIGRRLMEAVLERARQQGIRSVRLVQAAYHTRSLSLYAKLGFVAREPLAVMQGQPLALPIAGREVRLATEADQGAVNVLSRKIHGHDRAGEVREAIRQGTATVVEHDDCITGYATGIGFFGHAVGETTDDLKALIGAAPTFPGPGFMLPIRNAELFRWSLEQGLRIVQPMTLMSLGTYSDPQGAFLPSVLY